jgi:hypothetical protein
MSQIEPCRHDNNGNDKAKWPHLTATAATAAASAASAKAPSPAKASSAAAITAAAARAPKHVLGHHNPYQDQQRRQYPAQEFRKWF